MNKLFGMALVLAGAISCVANRDDLEGSQSHFFECDAHDDCKDAGKGYRCYAGECRSRARPYDAGARPVSATSNPESGAGSNAPSYVGRWSVDRETSAYPYYAYLVLSADAGETCVSDGKSQLQFDLVVDDSGVHMGQHELGGGDLLEVSADANHLLRTSSEKGAISVIEYVRFEGSLPTWCSEQLGDGAGGVVEP